ncbi:hypothetical protein [Brucella sp. IR073]|uniref:hypothetical protein n=1 Tax=unclassified Brucella TaxID=2632610 RepID=UPI003B985333
MFSFFKFPRGKTLSPHRFFPAKLGLARAIAMHAVVLGVAVTQLALLSTPADSADPVRSIEPVEATRPDGIPADYVSTPFGFASPRCIHLLDKKDTLLANGSVRKSNGTVRSVSRCTSPRYLSDGTVASSANPPVPQGSIWQMGVQVKSQNADPYAAQGLNFTVPAAPLDKNGPSLYFLVSLGVTNSNTIIASVLGWNQKINNVIRGAGTWTAAGWAIRPDGSLYVVPYSNSISPGDNINLQVAKQGAGLWQAIINNVFLLNSQLPDDTSKLTGYGVVFALDGTVSSCARQIPISNIKFRYTITLPPSILTPQYWVRRTPIGPGGCINYNITTSQISPIDYSITMNIKK